jgi:hypothetical protein
MEQKGFFITTMGDLLDTSDLIVTEDTLNNNIDLADFGKGVSYISFFALTYYDANGINEPFWNYDPDSRKIEGSLPLDYQKAAASIDEEAQKLVCHAIFELFGKVSDQVEDFDFEALKKSMLEAIEDNPAFAEKTRFRVYSDTGMITGDIPEFSRAIDLSKYGRGVHKLFFEVSFFKNPQSFLPDPPRFDKNKKGLYISVVSGLDINQFSSQLDRAFEKIKPQVDDFDFDLLKSDLLRFAESLKEAA